MNKGQKLPSGGKRPTTTGNENASRMNRTIPEEPTKEDAETNYNNSIERMG